MKRIILSCNLLLLVVSASLAKTGIYDLAVEYQQTPIGIDVKEPRFSWKMISGNDKYGVYQTAYQIQVTAPDGKVMWNSKKVRKRESVHIIYEGMPLESETRYDWTLTVWDHKDKAVKNQSWFETGLMNHDISAWDGAQWIGGGNEDLVFYSNYQIIFKLKYSLAIKEGSTNASFIYGVNDIRLLNKNKNIFGIENKKDQSYIKLELDISDLEQSDSGAKLNIYRVGYKLSDKADVPFKTFVILSSIINSANKNKPHRFEIRSAYGEIQIRIDGEDMFFVENKRSRAKYSPAFLKVQPGALVNLNPHGKGGDYIPMGMICEMGFSMEPNQQALFSDLEIYNDRMPHTTLFKEDLQKNYSGIYENRLKIDDGSYLLEGGTNGVFIVANPSKNSAPMLRTEFCTENQIQSARLYVTARGIYELFINGERVGNDYYNPGFSQYNKTHFYQIYDVTSLLKEGQNAIGAMMSEGWWSGLMGFVGPEQIWNHFGDRQSLLAKLVINYSDGSKKIITSNNKDWKYWNSGPIVYSSLFLGEVYDARKEVAIQGWTKPGYDCSGWANAINVPMKEGTTFSGEDSDMFERTVDLNFENYHLVGQIGNNSGIYKTLAAKSVSEVRPGVFVYDMGQNFVGVPKITLENGTQGDSLILRFSEMLYPDLKESGENVGMIMTENYRAALSQDIYIMKDGFQVFQPKFTSHGYRYIEITGIDKALPLSAVEGMAISSVLDITASYETSNHKVNQLWANLVWSNVCNFLTLPTDCPQRNERMGWSGDISVFAKTSTYLSNTDQFLKRHLVAMRDLQHKDGRFADIAPVGGGFGGILWGSAGITVPWELYQQYNDVGVLEENYDAMVSYVDYINKNISPETGMCHDVQLGDWLGLQNNKLGAQYLATAYHVYDLWIIKEVAKLLEKRSDAERFEKMYDQRKLFFNESFVGEDGRTMGFGPGFIFGKQPGSETEFKIADTQTSYAVGLALNAFNEEGIPLFAQKLANTVSRENTDDNGKLLPKYSLMTGFIGTAYILNALSENGYNEEAYRLLQSEHYPSWLYSVNQGATTIWERLNGYTIENGFGGNNSMNSFNHYSFGAVGQWMIEYSLGIKRDKPGFQQFILCPKPDPTGQMTWAKGWYDSMYGRIESEWKVEKDKTLYKFRIPANTSATLILPVSEKSSVKEIHSEKSEGMISKLMQSNGDNIYNLSSGTYVFEIKQY
jgi:alpha-L-rhamnosidase